MITAYVKKNTPLANSWWSCGKSHFPYLSGCFLLTFIIGVFVLDHTILYGLINRNEKKLNIEALLSSPFPKPAASGKMFSFSIDDGRYV